MTRIKTLAEAKKDFDTKFADSVDGGNLNEDWPMVFQYKGVCDHDEGFWCEHRKKALWNWFKSTLSSLTEQMIPEEGDRYEFDTPEEWDGYSKAISEMKERRAKILGK